MTEEFREKVAKIIRPIIHSDWYPKDVHDEVTLRVTDQILALIKEAGYISSEDYQEIISELANIQAEVKDALIKNSGVGYVKLADDQSFPLAIRVDYKDTQQDFVREGWRKVEVKDES